MEKLTEAKKKMRPRVPLLPYKGSWRLVHIKAAVRYRKKILGRKVASKSPQDDGKQVRDKKRLRQRAVLWRRSEIKHNSPVLVLPVSERDMALALDTEAKELAEKYFAENPLQNKDIFSAEDIYAIDDGGYYSFSYPSCLPEEEKDAIEIECEIWGFDCKSDDSLRL